MGTRADFVDRCQDWSGEWPVSDGPVVRLVTTAGDRLVAVAVAA